MTRRRPVASPSFAGLSYCVLLTTSTVILGFVTPGFAQQRIIELQVNADSRARVGTQRRWMEMLSTVGADRVVMKTGFVAEPEIEETKLSSSAW